MDEFDEFLTERETIVKSIREIKVEQGQALRQVQVPDSVYQLAKRFIKRVPNVYPQYGHIEHMRYGVLYSIESGGIYELLIRDAEGITASQATEKISQWKEALKSLLRYALNLLLAPKRPEFQSMKVRHFMNINICMYSIDMDSNMICSIIRL